MFQLNYIWLLNLMFWRWNSLSDSGPKLQHCITDNFGILEKCVASTCVFSISNWNFMSRVWTSMGWVVMMDICQIVIHRLIVIAQHNALCMVCEMNMCIIYCLFIVLSQFIQISMVSIVIKIGYDFRFIGTNCGYDMYFFFN